MTITYRADGRNLRRIRGQGGFHPTITTIKTLVDARRHLTEQVIQNLSTEHLITNLGYLSTGPENMCEGYFSKGKIMLKIDISSLNPIITAEDIRRVFHIPSNIELKGVIPYLDTNDINTARILAFKQKTTDELDFLTRIECVNIKAFRRFGETTFTDINWDNLPEDQNSF